MLRDALMAGLVRLQRGTGATDEWQLRADNDGQQRGLPPFLPRRRKSAPSPSRTSVSSAAFVVMGGKRSLAARARSILALFESEPSNATAIARWSSHAQRRRRD